MCGKDISANTCYLLQVTNRPGAGWPGRFTRGCASLVQLCLCKVLCQRLALFIHLNSKKLGQCVKETPKFFTFFLKSLPITIKRSLNLLFRILNVIFEGVSLQCNSQRASMVF